MSYNTLLSERSETLGVPTGSIRNKMRFVDDVRCFLFIILFYFYFCFFRIMIQWFVLTFIFYAETELKQEVGLRYSKITEICK